MANPSIIAASSIKGETDLTKLSSTSATVVLNNPAASGEMLAVSRIIVTNVDASSPYAITVSHYPQDDIGGTAHELVKAIPVPAKSALIVPGLNVKEDRSLGCVAEAADKLQVAVVYDRIAG